MNIHLEMKLKIIFIFLGTCSVSFHLNAEDVLKKLKNQIPGMYTSFSGNFTSISSSGKLSSGKIYYQYPGKLYLKKSDGSIIATNGHYLWIFKPKLKLCIRQDVDGLTDGIFGMLKEYSGSAKENVFVFENEELKIHRIIVRVENKMLKSIKLMKQDSEDTISLSEIVVGSGIKASLYNYKPPVDAQLIINPMNN